MIQNTLVTIFSDASHSGDIAGFHYWYKSKSKSSHGSGSAAGVFSTCAAELMGKPEGAAEAIPDGYTVIENSRTGLPFLKKTSSI